MRGTQIHALLLACATLAVAADDPAAQLKSARSLHCIFTSSATTAVRGGQRIVEQHYDKDSATFNNVDLAKGTARIVPADPRGGADYVKVWWDSSGSLRLVRQSLSGRVVSTTVFPIYASGTQEFVVLQSWHSTVGTTATDVSGLDETEHGTCKRLE
jgi:hypothetical protein